MAKLPAFMRKRFEKHWLIEKFLRVWNSGLVRCDICGMWVKDVEVPLHTTSRGGSYVHNLHVICSTNGRKLISDMAGLVK